MAEDQHRTIHAQQAFEFVDVFNLKFAIHTFGASPKRRIKLMEPEVSTDGGRKARQPVVLAGVDDEGARPLVCGWLDVPRRVAELRTYGALRQQFEGRAGAQLDLPRDGYDRAIQELVGFLKILRERQEMLEAAARPALEAAGFRPAAAGATPDVTVQVGGRVTRTDHAPWDDPLWWRGGFGLWRYGPWVGPRWGAGVYTESPRYEREVALLIRSRASGEPLYETRASSDGLTRGDTSVMRAMFAAALQDFPATGVRPRTVTTPLGP